MGKKIFATGIIAIILLFFSTVFCYATENNSKTNNNVNLGDELTNSMNKMQNTAGNMKNKVTNESGAKEMGNEMKSNYNTVRTSVNDTLENTTGMNGTTWIWIILAVTGIVILATVWFYAMQNSSND